MSAPALPPPPPDLPAPVSGRFVAGVHYFPVRTYFEDTDAGGVVYHANYLRFFERARSDMLRLIGINQREALENGRGAYFVTNVSLDFLRPVRLDDTVMIESRVAKVSATRCVIDQIIRRADTLLTRAQVTVAFVGPDGRSRRQPADWLELFQRLSTGEDLHL